VRHDPDAEWLEADGLGGFASGTVGGVRTRRYHAVLLAALEPPGRRCVLVNAVEAWVETGAGTFALSTHLYVPGVRHPDGVSRLVEFGPEPWPTWRHRLPEGVEVEHELLVPRGHAAAMLAWRRATGRGRCLLHLKPLLSGRDFHALHHENPAFRFDAEVADGRVAFGAYPGLAPVIARHNGAFEPRREWFRAFQYEEERRRGLDFVEDLGCPGELHFDLARGEAVLLLAAGTEAEAAALGESGELASAARRLRASEKRRRARFPSRLHRAADAYLVRRGAGSTVIAGYPWFSDWGRDTFIALRGLCLAGGRLDVAGQILSAWAGTVRDGLLPNRFAEAGEPEYQAVDASLWFVVAAREWLDAMAARKKRVAAATRRALLAAVSAILEGYAGGTRFGIRMDADGLIAAGVPGIALTWMDARIGGEPVTPRIGKPVEVQALWVNALDFGSRHHARWKEPLARARASFEPRFWNEAEGALHDVVDVEHRAGEVDASFRPNQIFAVGGLPVALLEGAPARRIVEAVEARLWTPLGLRTLAPGSPGYAPRYAGGPGDRDRAYHQGTAWPWLGGAFVEAWVRVRGGSAEAKAEARARFLTPLIEHLDRAGLGHVSEVADAEPPHHPGGCPFQAWSVAELLRLDQDVLATSD
jgi:predicted glycogen debranching enzyme